MFIWAWIYNSFIDMDIIQYKNRFYNIYNEVYKLIVTTLFIWIYISKVNIYNKNMISALISMNGIKNKFTFFYFMFIIQLVVMTHILNSSNTVFDEFAYNSNI